MGVTVLEQENRLKIAVLQEQLGSWREQQRAYNESTQSRLSGIEHKIDELTAIMNRGRGAYAASMAVAAGLGALLIEGLNLALSYIHK